MPDEKPSRAREAPADGGSGAGGLELSLGGRLPIWIGSVALALAGAFLVKYSIDQGLLSPTVRVILGVGFGLGLLFAADFLRKRTAGIAAGLAAAGIAILFASFLAATSAYELLNPTVGFGLMGLTALVGVALSITHGRIVAAVGLASGYLTPALVGGDTDGGASSLFGYLLLLQFAMLAVARRRGWPEMALGALLGGAVWFGAWMLGGDLTPSSVTLAMFALATVGGFVVFAFSGDSTWESRRDVRLSMIVAFIVGLIMVAAVTPSAGLGTVEWGMLAILLIASVALSIRDSAYMPLSWFGTAAVAGLLLIWPKPGLNEVMQPFLVTGLGMTAVVGAMGYAGLTLARRIPAASAPLGASAAPDHDLPAPAKARRAPAPGSVWAVFVTLAPLLIAGATYVRAWNQTVPVSWGVLSLVAAALYTLAVARELGGAPSMAAAEAGIGDPADSGPLTDSDHLADSAHLADGGQQTDVADREGPGATSVAFLAAAATLYVSLAVPLELDREWLTVAWALEIPALLWLSGRFNVRILEQLAQVMAVLVTVRLIVNPGVLEYPIGTSPVVNWLLWGYGVPAVALVLAARVAKTRSNAAGAAPRPAVDLSHMAIAVATVFFGLQVRQLFHPGELDAAGVEFLEGATLSVVWLAFAAILLPIVDRSGLSQLRVATLVVAGLGVGTALLLPGLGASPLMPGATVGGTPILNWLLYAFGVPALLAVHLARELRRRGQPVEVWRSLAAVALYLTFLLVTFEVRHLFHGSELGFGPVSTAEQYAYSLAWMLYGTTLLVLGIARHNRLIRLASLGVMLVAIVKVFLYDMAALTDLYRVGSFLGLGVSLLLLAYLYQRFVFAEAQA